MNKFLFPTSERIKKGINNPRLIRAWISAAVERGIYVPYASVALSLLSCFPVGYNLFDADWDLAIILDTCRVDALRSVKHEYEFISDVKPVTSIGSKTSEWVAQTFTQKYLEQISETAYLPANLIPEMVLDRQLTPEEHSEIPVATTDWNPAQRSDFKYFESAARYEPDGRLGHPKGPTPPQYTADRAIWMGRNIHASRYIVHFVQPHYPYTREAVEQDRKTLRPVESDFEWCLRKGTDKRDAWELYIKELKFCLDSVKLLLENFEANKVIITSDHGEGFGEKFGFEHPCAAPHSQIRCVPFVETSASDMENSFNLHNEYTDWSI